MKKLIFSTLIVLFLFSTFESKAVIRYVKTNGTPAENAANATSWATACSDLQAVINVSRNNDEIWVAAGTYKPNRKANDINVITPNNIYNSFVITNNVKLYGGFPATGNPTMTNRNYAENQTILSGDFNNNDIIIGNEQGINNNSENALHVMCIVGGAAYQANPLINGFVFKGGNARYDYEETVEIEGIEVPNDNGGGLFLHSFSGTIVNCELVGNNSAGSGGAIYLASGSANFVNCLIHKNNCLNTTGGGMYFEQNSNPNIINSTVSFNYATEGVGGVHCASTNLRIVNSILIDNLGFNNYNDLYSAGDQLPNITYSLVGGINSGTGNLNGNSITAQQVFVTPRIDYKLLNSAPTVNSGQNSAFNANYGQFDLANKNRIMNTTIDMGAFENQFVPISSISILPELLEISIGNTSYLKVVAFPQGAIADGGEWTSTNNEIATVDEEGMVTAVSPGITQVYYTIENYSAFATVTVVNTAVTGIEIDPNTLNLEIDEYKEITAKLIPENASNQNISWSSSDESIATVATGQFPNVGIVGGISNGIAIITAKTADGGFTAQCTVTVGTPEIPVTGISLTPTNISIMIDESSTLTATILPEDATNKAVNWSSSDEEVISIISSQTSLKSSIKGLKEGTAIVTVQSVDGNFTAKCTVTVSKVTIPVLGIVVNPTNLSIKVGESGNISATINPQTATNKKVSWKSSDESIATTVIGQFTTECIVQGVKEGTVVITATTEDGKHSAQCTVKVSSNTIPVDEIMLDLTSLTIKEGETKNLLATIIPTDATNVKINWTSSNENVAKISQGQSSNIGIISAILAGNTTITATTEDGNKTATCNVTVLKKGAVDESLNYKIYTGDKYLFVDISNSNFTDHIIKIYNILGLCVYENKSPDQMIRIPLNTGIYLIKFGDYFQKVVIN